MAQWRSSAIALVEVKRQDMRELADEQARKDSEMLLSMAPIADDPRRGSQTSGLVEQQRYFAKARAC